MACAPKEVRTLVKLLGPGAAGKSTLVKCVRMAMAEDQGTPCTFEEGEKEHKRLAMEKNAIESILRLCERARALFPELSNVKELKDKMDKLTGKKNWTRITTDQAELIVELWGEQVIKDTWEQRHTFLINSNTSYLLPKVCDFIKGGYVVTDEDILQAREETKRGEEFIIRLKDAEMSDCTTCCTGKMHKVPCSLNILDMGGQDYHKEANEKTSIFHEYKAQASIIFLVVPLGDLRQQLKPGVTEALLLLDNELGDKGNSNRNFVVFLNKFDLFQDAIKAAGKGAMQGWLASAKSAARTQKNEELAKLFAEQEASLAALNVGEGDAAASNCRKWFQDCIVNKIVSRHRRVDKDGMAEHGSFQGSIDTFATVAVVFEEGLKEALIEAVKMVREVLSRDLGFLDSAKQCEVGNPVHAAAAGPEKSKAQANPAKRQSVMVSFGDSYGRGEFD